MIGKNLAINMWFISWDMDFPIENCISVSSLGGVSLITWEPALSTTNTLEAIISGSYDSYIDSFAQNARDCGDLVYLRFGHEMNGNWYGWSGSANGGSIGPAKYISAWLYIHNIFTQEAATNVKWVWSPNSKSTPSDSWNEATDYYPGNDYVDWIAIDGYNWAQGNWQTFDEIFSTAYSTFSAYSKPMMIGEFACATDEVYSKADWITDAFNQIEINYPKFRAFNWFNENKERDWRIDSSSESLNSFTNAISGAYFLETKPTE